jgi:hypothetical protein
MKAYYRVHKSPPPVPILNHINPFHCCFSESLPSNALSSTLQHELRKGTKILSVTGIRTDYQKGKLLNAKQTWPQSPCETEARERNADSCSYVSEYRDMGRAGGCTRNSMRRTRRAVLINDVMKEKHATNSSERH